MEANDRRQLEERAEVFAARARRVAPHCDNETQTRTSLINPYLELLGYDVRDPVICRMEFTADIGKSGERVDYAILQDGEPSILIEAKPASMNLRDEQVPSQLQRYFIAVKAKFAVLTNGLVWRWFRSDGAGNMLESVPFLTHDVRYPGTLERNWLLSIAGPSFDSERALAQAEGERMNSAFLRWIDRARHNPDEDFLKLLIRSSQLGQANASRVKRARDSFLLTFKYYLERETDRLLDAARDQRQDAGRQPPVDATAPPPQETTRHSHNDGDVLDIGDGKAPLKARGMVRAWRVLGQPWRREPNGKILQVSVCQYLASQDIRGAAAFYAAARWENGRQIFLSGADVQEQRNPQYYRLVDEEADIWVNADYTGRDRRVLLERLCGLVHRPNSQRGVELEFWLPAQWSRRSG